MPQAAAVYIACLSCLLNVLLYIPDLPGHCDRRSANGLVTDDFLLPMVCGYDKMYI